MQIVHANLFPSSEAKLTGYLHEPGDVHIQRNIRPCVLIFPGGGYRILASHESEPVATRFYAEGYQAFTLSYSTCRGEPLRDLPLREAAAAMAVLREHAAEWRIDPHKIAVCGFSAGGHLAASLGVHWNSGRIPQADRESAKPNALILCYPVITAEAQARSESIQNLVGKDEDPAPFQLERHVGPDTPPVFLWHTADDPSVPVNHSLLFLSKLQQHRISFESHIYAHGPHGLSLATAETTRTDDHIATWFPLCAQWLGQLFSF